LLPCPRLSGHLRKHLVADYFLAMAGLHLWPSLHVALSNASVFVDFSTESNCSTTRNTTLSLVDMETNTTLLTRTLPNGQSEGRIEFNCSCFLYAGTFRFLLRQTSIIAGSRANGTDGCIMEGTTWWWSSELQVQWPTFHIAVERAGNHSGSFLVGISTNEYFQACSSSLSSALSLEVSYMEYNQIGRNSIDKVRARTRHPIQALRSQSVELPCAFPFTDKDFIRVAVRSPHTTQEVKSSGPLYLSRIFSYKLLVDNANAYRTGCEGAMTVKLVTPPCAHINGKVLLYKDGGVGKEPSSPPLAFNWLTQGENETEFNCSVFYPGRNKYCFRFVFNFSRSPSPAQTCLVVHRSTESWGPWQPWSVCSVSCGEGVRERVRDCLLPSSAGGLQCTGMVKEQSLCSLEDCVGQFPSLPAPSPSLPPAPVGVAPLGGNLVVVAGICLCLAVILATVVVTVWRKLCRAPQCSSVRRGSMHSPGGRKLSDEASICGHSLQRPSLSESQGPPGGLGMGVGQKDRPPLGSQPLSQPLVVPLPQDPERLSPSGQKMLPPIFGYRLAQQQLKEMKKKGLKEATQLYHVSSRFIQSGLTTGSVPLGLQEEANLSHFRIAAPFSEPRPQLQTSKTMPDRLSPRVELVLGPPVSGYAGGGSSKWRDRTADWVEMVERSGLAGLRNGGDAGGGNSYQKNPHFRRTSSFNDTKPQPPPATHSGHFRERTPDMSSKTDVNGTGERERQRSGGTGGGRGISGIGGPAQGSVSSNSGDRLGLERAEQNWNRRGPSPIQRNMLARKLKEAQSSSGHKARQRSSTFSASSSEQRKGRCRSLPMSGDYSSSDGSAYRLSEAEQRMLDLDLETSLLKCCLFYCLI
uniref:Thrombospondin, type I, domain containing 1 n=1 Tax=Myripristis murdjan TaxID=586833 RepID=A0A667XVF1_9TELE